jgi:hypothetical protein
MKNKTIIFCFVFTAFISSIINLLASPQQVTSQIDVNDSLSLPQILKQVLENYPTVAKAQEANPAITLTSLLMLVLLELVQCRN